MTDYYEERFNSSHYQRYSLEVSSVIVIQSMKRNAPFQLECFLQGTTRIFQADWTQETAVNCLLLEINRKVQAVLSTLDCDCERIAHQSQNFWTLEFRLHK